MAGNQEVTISKDSESSLLCLICNQSESDPLKSFENVSNGLDGISSIFQISYKGDSSAGNIIGPETEQINKDELNINPFCTKCSSYIDEFFEVERLINQLLRRLNKIKRGIGSFILESFDRTPSHVDHYALKQKLYEAWLPRTRDTSLARSYQSHVQLLSNLRDSNDPCLSNASSTTTTTQKPSLRPGPKSKKRINPEFVQIPGPRVSCPLPEEVGDMCPEFKEENSIELFEEEDIASLLSPSSSRERIDSNEDDINYEDILDSELVPQTKESCSSEVEDNVSANLKEEEFVSGKEITDDSANTAEKDQEDKDEERVPQLTERNATSHEETHQAKKIQSQHKCPHCPDFPVFNRIDAINQHFRAKHPNIRLPDKWKRKRNLKTCSVCPPEKNATWSNGKYLRKHMKMYHTGNNPPIFEGRTIPKRGKKNSKKRIDQLEMTCSDNSDEDLELNDDGSDNDDQNSPSCFEDEETTETRASTSGRIIKMKTWISEENSNQTPNETIIAQKRPRPGPKSKKRINPEFVQIPCAGVFCPKPEEVSHMCPEFKEENSMDLFEEEDITPLPSPSSSMDRIDSDEDNNINYEDIDSEWNPQTEESCNSEVEYNVSAKLLKDEAVSEKEVTVDGASNYKKHQEEDESEDKVPQSAEKKSESSCSAAKVPGGYKCPYCDSLIKHRSNFSCHLRSHTGERPLTCRLLCGMSFHRPANRRLHEKKHCENIQNISSDNPEEKGAKKKMMFQKRRKNWDSMCTSTAQGDKIYKCEYCSKTYRNSWLLSEHINKHTGEKPFKCKLCEKAFSSYGCRRKHELTHNKSRKEGEPKHECDICGKKYHLSGTLYHHRRLVHLGKKHSQNDVCDVEGCGKRFAGQAKLMQHKKRVHTEPTKANCKICGKLCPNLASAKSHETTHQPKKIPSQYKCPNCPDLPAFNTKVAVRRHLKAEHPPSIRSQYKCPHCPDLPVFKRQISVRQHFRAKHPNVPLPVEWKKKRKLQTCSICPEEKNASWSEGICLRKHMKKYHSGENPRIYEGRTIPTRMNSKNRIEQLEASCSDNSDDDLEFNDESDDDSQNSLSDSEDEETFETPSRVSRSGRIIKTPVQSAIKTRFSEENCSKANQTSNKTVKRTRQVSNKVSQNASTEGTKILKLCLIRIDDIKPTVHPFATDETPILYNPVFEDAFDEQYDKLDEVCTVKEELDINTDDDENYY